MGPALSRSLSALKRPDVNVLALDKNWYWSAHQLIMAYKVCLANVHASVAGGDLPTAGTHTPPPPSSAADSTLGEEKIKEMHLASTGSRLARAPHRQCPGRPSPYGRQATGPPMTAAAIKWPSIHVFTHLYPSRTHFLDVSYIPLSVLSLYSASRHGLTLCAGCLWQGSWRRTR